MKEAEQLGRRYLKEAEELGRRLLKEAEELGKRFLKEAGELGRRFLKKAKELGMLADPGPEVEGYVERNFQDEAPSGREADVYIAELERDFAKDDE